MDDAKDQISSEEINTAFFAHEKGVKIQNYRVACILALIFMPAGAILELLVYPEHVGYFFVLRLFCSAALLFIWWFVTTNVGSNCFRALGLALPLLPTAFISLMIYETEGPASSYYAGLNLVLLGAAIVLKWSFIDSVIMSVSVLIIYVYACLAHRFVHGHEIGYNFHPFWNNLYFLFVTGFFAIIGNFFYNKLRFREFALRYELDLNKRELEESNAKLVELDRIKSRFFGNISHELRTPLTLLLAPLESMLNRTRDQFDRKTRGLLKTMQANGMRLLKLINDLLDLVRLESGAIQIKREAVNVSDFITGLAGAAHQMAEDKEIQLQTRVNPEVGHVMLDRDKLEKVVLNLQFNSLKFTPRGGKVMLEAWRDKDCLVLQVQDTGMGIPNKQLPHIFDRFWQADDSSRRKYQGVGIGLSLVKELVEAHDGSVVVSSELNVGTTFTIHLPYLEGSPTRLTSSSSTPMGDIKENADPALLVAAAPAPDTELTSKDETQELTSDDEKKGTVSNQEWLSELFKRAELFPTLQSEAAQEDAELDEEEFTKPAPPHPQLGKRARLLIADDEFGMRKFIKTQLENDFIIVEAEDGQEAVDKVKEYVPELILLDMMMPEKDGLQACKEIREHPFTKNTPIVMLTARADEDIKLAALQAGASDFLSKPFSTTELQVRICNLVKSFSYQRELAHKNETLETTIHQLKQAEAQLVETEKLASLGRMSAGIIHEINNPLNFATTGLYTLRKLDRCLAEEERDEYREIIQDVEEGLGRVKTIVSDLRSFSHHDGLLLEQIDAQGIFASSLRFLSHEWKGRILVEQDVAEGLNFEANRNRIIQVLVNLMQNAIDSMNAKEYGNEQPALRIRGWRDNGFCRLSIRDNGMGINEEDRGKIFDPFFTTKDVGEGMGLGLSICYRIIKDYHGMIEVHSEPGRYCEFQLNFPTSE